MKRCLFALLLVFLTACAGPPLAPATRPSAQNLPPTTATPAPLLKPVAAATPPEPPATPSPPATATPEMTRLVVWDGLPAAQSAKLDEDIAAFQQYFPHTIIERQRYNDQTTLITAILEGRVNYDVILGASGMVFALQKTRKIQPMNELFSPGFLDGFIGVGLNSARLDGRIWGLPDTVGFHLLLFYNQDLLDAPPATLKDLAQLAADGGLALNSYDPLWLLPWLGGDDGRLVDDAGRPNLNTPAMVSALEIHKNLRGKTPPPDYAAGRNLFAAGQAAAMINGEWAIGELENTSLPWAVAPLPVFGKDAQAARPLVLGRYWVVGAETTGRRAEAALSFLEFITAPERQLARLAAFGLLPTRRSALTAPPVLTNPVWRVSAQQMQAGRSVPLNVDVNRLLTAMRGPLEQFMAGELSAEEAARQMQEQAK